MPNLSKMEEDEKKVKTKEKKVLSDKEQRDKLTRRISDNETIMGMFEHPGWPLLKAQFQDLMTSLNNRFLAEEPVADNDLQLLRAQMVYANKVLNLDIDISDTLKSLKDSIKAIPAELADGQGNGDANSGSKI